MASRTDRSTSDRSAPRWRWVSPTGLWARALPAASATAMAMLLAILVSACVGDVPDVPSGDPVLVQGREVYSRNCVGCHGAAGQGGTGSKLADGVVTTAFPDPADQFAIIANGKNQMPAFTGKLSDDEIEAVVRFTREGL